MELLLHVDGGARGNPGPAGAGIRIGDDTGQTLYEAAFFLGNQTNNVAEYTALIRALERAASVPADAITIHSDSELLVRQITGEYRVKSPRLIGLHEQAQRLLLKLPRWRLKHVPREQNKRADELANLAMDRQRDVIVANELGDDADAATTDDPPAEAPDATEVPTPKPAGRPAVRVTVSRPPEDACCPAGGVAPASFTVEHTLPAGLCIHAAHAILPTLLAILNTEPHEFAAVPTLTVRCTYPACRAEFQLSPVHSPNGRSTPADE